MSKAQLILATGHTFLGSCPGSQVGNFFGEVVFNTGMVGYVEALTDPSYAGQLLCFTYPLIGNYGVPDKSAWESDRIQAAGLIVSELAPHHQHYAANQSLLAWCQDQGVPVIYDIDTRALARKLSAEGVVLGAINHQAELPSEFIDINQQNLVAEVTCPEIQTLGNGANTLIVVDCGIKNNILRHFSQFDLTIKRVPYDYDYTQDDYDAVFISNGPGAPEQCQQTIEILRKHLLSNKPTFGICLGSQIMALAIGTKTYKLPFGHRAQNHPCQESHSKRCYLTSQNHGFSIVEDSLPQDWQVSFRNLNDGTVQGIEHKTLPFFSVQFHPEEAPGPTDTQWLFKKFVEML